jgi:hypothetical protein
MGIDNKILQEIKRHNSINKYILEQGELPPPPAEAAAPVTPPAPEEALAPAAPVPPATPEGPQVVDVANDPDVEEVGKETEELEITDLVDAQKSFSDKQEEYFTNLFDQLQNLESKLGEMDNLVNTINNLEVKIEKMRPKTPEEKLELRSLDSGPFNQKLSQFFDDKMDDMEKSGKNEYVLTTDEVEDYSPNEIKGSFNDFEEDDNDIMM